MDNLKNNKENVIEIFSSRVKQKIDTFNYLPILFNYLLIEEILLLTNAPAVFIGLNELDAKNKWKKVFADANIVQADLTTLENIAKENKIKILSDEIECIQFNSSHIPFKNGNLKDVNHQIKITIKDASINISLDIRIWFDSNYLSTKYTVLSQLMTGKFSWLVLKTQLTELLWRGFINTSATSDINKPSLNLKALKTNQDGETSYKFIDQKVKFFKETGTNTSFIDRYAKRFSALDSIVTQLQETFEKFQRESHDRSRYANNFMFSYRTSNESNISLLLSSNQLRKSMEEGNKVLSEEEISDLLLFEFPANIGLSGYILATGHSEFCHKPNDDSRWTGQSDENKRIQTIIGKFHGGNDSQEDIFLVPMGIRHFKSEGAKILGYSALKNNLLLAVECRLYGSLEEQLHMRRRLFDIAWYFMPFVESAIVNQQTIERELYLIEEGVRKTQAINKAINASNLGVKDIPHSYIQPSVLLVDNIFEALASNDEQKTVKKHLDKIKQNLNNATGLILAVPEWNKPENWMKTPFDCNEFKDKINNMGIDSNDISINCNNIENNVLSEIQHIIGMIKIHLDNSKEAFDKIDNKTLSLKVDIDIQIEKNPNCFIIKINDNCLGMQQEMLINKQENIDLILSGKKNQVYKSSDQKMRLRGSGILSNAERLFHIWGVDMPQDIKGIYVLKKLEQGLSVHFSVPISIM